MKIIYLTIRILFVRRKTDAMQPYNLFSLLADRLLVHINGFTMSTYNILFEVDSIDAYNVLKYIVVDFNV